MSPKRTRRSPLLVLANWRKFLRPMRQEYRDRWNMSLLDWLHYHHENVAFKDSYWMGVRALKNPMDAWIYQEILHEVKPDFVIEIGANEGGSTLYFAHLLDLLGKGHVISIDIDRSRYHVEHPRIIVLTGDSGSPEMAARVSGLCRGQSVLLVHDGDHRKPAVLRDLRNYAPLVPVGSYVIVEDGIVDLFRAKDGIGSIEDGPLAAVEEFLRDNPGFEVDPRRERYLLTYNPHGFLKRCR